MSLSDPSECKNRHSRLFDSHVASLNFIVEKIRSKHGIPWQVPFFDPNGAGTNAKVIFIFEAPGPRSVVTGLISVDNPDQTARNWTDLLSIVGIDYSDTCMWNICPVFISDENGSNRPPNAREKLYGKRLLHRVILPRFPSRLPICLVGNQAWEFRQFFEALGHAVFHCPHPSERVFSRYPHKRDEAIAKLEAVRAHIDGLSRG